MSDHDEIVCFFPHTMQELQRKALEISRENIRYYTSTFRRLFLSDGCRMALGTIAPGCECFGNRHHYRV